MSVQTFDSHHCGIHEEITTVIKNWRGRRRRKKRRRKKRRRRRRTNRAKLTEGYLRLLGRRQAFSPALSQKINDGQTPYLVFEEKSGHTRQVRITLRRWRRRRRRRSTCCC